MSRYLLGHLCHHFWSEPYVHEVFLGCDRSPVWPELDCPVFTITIWAGLQTRCSQHMTQPDSADLVIFWWVNARIRVREDPLGSAPVWVSKGDSHVELKDSWRVCTCVIHNHLTHTLVQTFTLLSRQNTQHCPKIYCYKQCLAFQIVSGQRKSMFSCLKWNIFEVFCLFGLKVGTVYHVIYFICFGNNKKHE